MKTINSNSNWATLSCVASLQLLLLVLLAPQLSSCQDLRPAIAKNETTTSATNSTNVIITSANQTTSASQETTNATLVPALSEQLVKQSNLQAEESRQSDASASFLPPPANWAPNQQQQQQQQQQQPQQQRQNQPPVSYKGGSGNAYMSMSRDGSNRYEFGYDTSAQSESTSGNNGGKKARLMREESRLEDGTVIGRYGYTDPFNVFRVVQYVAGADGYFATEDVGAMQSPSGKFQLNKQLYKALDQARQRRRRRRQDSDIGSASSEPLVAVEPRVAGQSSGRAEQASAESLAQSGSHQSIRYSSKINHVVGTNGVSYATAFRPVLMPQRQASLLIGQTPVVTAQRQQEPMMLSYQPVSSPNPVELLKRQHQAFEQQQQQAKLRSQLPAPIYSPNFPQSQPSSGQLSDELANEESPFSSAAPLQLPPPSQPSNSWSWSSAVSHQSSDSHQLPVQRVSRVLESPAWSLLNNNYNDHSTLIIDHSDTSGGSSKQRVSAQVAPQVGSNFEHEAAILSSLRSKTGANHQAAGQHWQPVALATAPQPQPIAVEQPRSQAMTFGMAYGGAAATPRSLIQINHNDNGAYSTRHFEFGKRTGSFGAHNQQPSSGSNYDFAGLALQHFNPPLYHPEVHQTTPLTESNSDPKPVVYSSTVLHSEVAAERDYRPERVQQLDALQSVASEQHNSTVNRQQQQQQHEQQQQEKQVVNHASEHSILEPVRYATRLSAQTVRAAPLEELDMDDSEQVSYLSASNVTRAKMPDRQRKLSSIFKARTSSLSGSHGDDSSSGRIRRPVPVNAKKQFGSLRIEQPSVVVESVAPSSAQNEQPRGVIVEVVEDSGNSLAPPEGHSAQKTPASQRKFGRGNHVAEKQQEVLGAAEVIETQLSAKRRPVLREQQQHHVTGNQYTAARQPQEQIVSQISSTTPSPASVPTATIIDATDQSKAGLDKELYEKIVRIQQEIARMSSKSSSTTTSTTTSTTKPPQTTTSTTTTTTEVPTTTSTTTTTTTTPVPTTLAPTTKRPAPVEPIARDLELATIQVSASPSEPPTTTSTTTPRPTTTTAVPSVFVAQRGSAGLGPSSSIGSGGKRLFPARKLITTTSRPATTTKSTKNLSGQLMKVESISAQDDLLQRLTMDMDAFDSTRGESFVKPQFLTPTTSAPPTTTTSSTSTTTTTPRPTTTTSTTTSTTTAAPTPTTTTTTTTTPLPATLRPLETTTPLPLRTANTNVRLTQVTATTTANFSSPAAALVVATTRPPPLAPVTTNTAAPVQMPTTTSTTTSAPLLNNNPTTLKPATRRTTQHPRFGRLVIKRGDKVVARYNGSEPIPDSVIPVAGNGSDIIMPDMPRLGMRRTVKKRVNQTLAMTSTTTTTSTTTAAPITTTTPLPLTARQQPFIDLNLPMINSTQEINKTAIEAAIISASPATIAALTSSTFRSGGARRTLSRGVRSHGDQDSIDGDLMFSESNQSDEMVDFGLPDLRKLSESLSSSMSTTTTTTTTTTTSTRRPSLAQTGGRNWSARLRDGRPQPSDKLYDPKEDLRKLVEKIASIEDGKPVIQTAKQPPATTSTTTTTTTGAPQAPAAASSSTIPPPFPLNPTSIAHLPHEKSESQSASYTVTMSPELEKKWTEMKPLGASESQRKPLGAARPQDIRVDSRGFIHVRHNQSVTIHVDIEPPKRVPVSTRNVTADATGGPSASSLTVRRLTGRDTSSAAVSSFGRADLHRLPKQALSRPTRSDGELAKAQAGSAPVESTRGAAQSKRPRLLCVEVDPNYPNPSNTRKSAQR